MIKKRLADLKDDVFLQHFSGALKKRHDDYLAVKKRLTSNIYRKLNLRMLQLIFLGRYTRV